MTLRAVPACGAISKDPGTKKSNRSQKYFKKGSLFKFIQLYLYQKYRNFQIVKFWNSKDIKFTRYGFEKLKNKILKI